MEPPVSLRQVIVWRTGAIAVFALASHLWVATTLPLDADEPTYLLVAGAYAAAIRSWDICRVVDEQQNREHPALAKLTYALGLISLGRGPNRSPLATSRLIAVSFGVLTIVLLSLYDPWAAVFLSLQTAFLKYTSLVYLEALPSLAAIVGILAMLRSSVTWDRWFWLSVGAVGATAAAKFTYAPVGVAVLFLALANKHYPWRAMGLYVSAVAAVAWVLNPSLWRDPFARLLEAAHYHAAYSHSPLVEHANFPWFQPFVWLATPTIAQWQPDTFIISLDPFIALLALVGLPREWQRRRWVVVWLIAGLASLLTWTTKWPHYAVVVAPPLCLCASSGLAVVWRLLRISASPRGRAPRQPPISAQSAFVGSVRAHAMPSVTPLARKAQALLVAAIMASSRVAPSTVRHCERPL